jgi:hypothetical protein
LFTRALKAGSFYSERKRFYTNRSQNPQRTWCRNTDFTELICGLKKTPAAELDRYVSFTYSGMVTAPDFRPTGGPPAAVG